MIEFIKAIIQGIIQGISEWLPISSTGHMLIFNGLWPFNLSDQFIKLFVVFIQIGSVLAVLVLFLPILNPFDKHKNAQARLSTYSLWMKIAVASIPAAVIGLLFDNFISQYLELPWVIACTLILYGLIFIIVERVSIDKRVTLIADITYKDAILIGIFQTLALIPGTSRSGATIVGALLLGFSRVVAAEFSFFLAIPVLLGAGGLKVIKLGLDLSFTEWMILLTGITTAFIVSLLVIKGLMRFVKNHSFTSFAYYRIGLGLLVLILIGFKVL
ncbi:MAG: undecaprenyl-diphosphate phosphatase [Erysipelotrichaceae bacterium]